MVQGELAQFIRSRRESRSPEDMGLPPAGRRRTPGLRREELATLAGVSIDYLVRIEQGRDTNPSGSVLAALADALRLPNEDRLHMAKLAMRENAGGMCPTETTIDVELRSTVRAMLDRLEPTPAFVLGPADDVIGWNRAWAAVAGSLGMLDDDPPNLSRYIFLHSSAPRMLPAWKDEADAASARMRAVKRCVGVGTRHAEVVAELSAVESFSDRWNAHPVASRRRVPLRLNHPIVGSLRLYVDSMSVDDADQTVLCWWPADEATDSALRELVAAPLRVVRPA